MTTITEGTVVDGDVTLQRALDAGGMGTIWEAQHTALGKLVAVKSLSKGPRKVEKRRGDLAGTDVKPRTKKSLHAWRDSSGRAG